MSDWIDQFGQLSQLSAGAFEQLVTGSRMVEFEIGERLFGPGMAPKHYMLLIEGSIRVQQISEQGREIVLYRIQPGESCALTTACLLGGEVYQAEALVEQSSRAIAVPGALFDELIADSNDFRQFVFSAFGTRITDLMRTVEEVAFQRIHTRLSQRLLELADHTNVVHMTHQQLSVELGSAREVVSRQLKEFERNGLIELTRGAVILTDLDSIRRLASSH